MVDPELITRWMVSADLWVTSAEVDPRVGGQFRIRQESPQGDKGGFDADIVELELAGAWSSTGILSGPKASRTTRSRPG